MPELPEVETIRRDLNRHILNKEIVQIDIRSEYAVRHDGEVKFNQTLERKMIEKIDRIGKLLLFHVANEPVVALCHLRMTGQLIYRRADALLGGGGHSLSKSKQTLPHQHTRIIFTFSDGSKLFFNDSRQFGYFKLQAKNMLQEVYAKFGIEPLTPLYTHEKFVAILGKRKASIKAALLNQQLFAGFGNIYADETCFAAGVSPDRSVASLTDKEKELLFLEGQRIIALATEQRGTTFNNYVDGKGKKGGFVRLLHVYQRQGKTCLRCSVGIIRKIRVAQRGTHFCPSCQT